MPFPPVVGGNCRPYKSGAESERMMRWFRAVFLFLYYFPSKVYARKPLYAKITMGDEDDKDQRTGI